MGYSTLNIQANVQIFSPGCPELMRSPGQPSHDFQAVFRRHHHDCGGDDHGCRGDHDDHGCHGDYDDHGNHGCCDGQGDPLTVNGNTVNTGRYTISASTDESGMLTVKDNVSGESFKVWGDPHITTDKGDTTDFQHAPATFDLPDGTRITVDPTKNSGVNYINDVTITKGNDAVEMTGFQGGTLKTQELPGEGHYLDRTTPEGTVLTAHNGNIDQLQLSDGTRISGNKVKNIDSYANQGPSCGQWNQEINQLQQEISQLQQEIGQLEQSMTMCSSGFMSDPFEQNSFC